MGRCIIAVGLYSPGSGFTNVLTSLFAELSRRHQIYWIGVGYKGQPITNCGYTILPNNLKGGDIYGAYQATKLLREKQADIFFVLCDVWMMKNFKNILETPISKRSWRNICYTPLDGNVIEASDVSRANEWDQLVCYTKSSAKEMSINLSRLSTSDHANVSHIGHGIMLNNFLQYGLSRKKSLKREIFKSRSDGLHILNANRFNERKNIGATLEGFAKAVRKCKTKMYLVLHTPNLIRHQEDKLHGWVQAHGLQDQVILNPLGPKYVCNEQLNDLYNACEIGINTSRGEGWGLISMEHAATGAAQIVPNHTAPGEIWKDVAVLLPKEKTVKIENNPFSMYDISTDVLAHALVRLVKDPAHLNEISTRCYRHAHQPEFRWEEIAREWFQIFDLAISESKQT